MDFNSELKNKLNKHAAENSEKLSDLKELQSMQFSKKYYIGLKRYRNPYLHSMWPFSRFFFSLYHQASKRTKFTSLNELNCSCCCFDIDHSLKSPHLLTTHIKSEVSPYRKHKLFSPQLTAAFK